MSGNPWDHMMGFLESEATAGTEGLHVPSWLDWDLIAGVQASPEGPSPSMADPASKTPVAGLADLSEGSVQELSDDMKAIYAAINETFLETLPKPVRQVIVQRWNNVASSTALGRASSTALCMLQFLRLPENNNPEAQERILAQSNHYFERAIAHLADDALPLESQLNSVIDMHYHQLDVGGAAAAYAVLLVGETFVVQAMGERPVVDFSRLNGAQSMVLRLYAYIDAFRTLCLGGRRTLFDYIGVPASLAAEDASLEESAILVAPWVGLPVHLLLAFAATSNLAVEAPSLPQEVVRNKAAEIEKTIRNWRGTVSPNSGPMRDSIAYLRLLGTQEMWRHAALIHLYQTVLKLGCLSSLITESLHQIIGIGSEVVPGTRKVERLSAEACTRACPWFLAATVAVTKEDRDACREGLLDCGPSKVFEDNRRAAEFLWDRMDVVGRDDDWKAVLREAGLHGQMVG
ncbi:Zn(2)-C6 fungal-type transcription factor [Pseudohyphozyma bogoriensis]|nr:Zn(2)-C6 fungal-type transcription factor [Pseudohyphozyma bogoriensis]